MDQLVQHQQTIHFASFYLPGDFVPHVRIMNTGYQTASLGNLFGLPYVVMRKPEPIDTTTLNYNWQIWETNAFSVYTKETDEIDEHSAQEAVAAVPQPGGAAALQLPQRVSFLCRAGI